MPGLGRGRVGQESPANQHNSHWAAAAVGTVCVKISVLSSGVWSCDNVEMTQQFPVNKSVYQ